MNGICHPTEPRFLQVLGGRFGSHDDLRPEADSGKTLVSCPTWLRILTIQEKGGTSNLFQKAGANKPTWSVPEVTRVWGIQQILLSTS